MAEPVAFEPLIKGVPGESLFKQSISFIPTKIQHNIFIEDLNISPFTIYTVPKGYVYEIVYIQQAVSSAAASDRITFLFSKSPGATSPTISLMNHRSCAIGSCFGVANFPPLNIILNENDVIISHTTLQTDRTIIIHGFLIKKTEFNEKTDILI